MTRDLLDGLMSERNLGTETNDTPVILGVQLAFFVSTLLRGSGATATLQLYRPALLLSWRFLSSNLSLNGEDWTDLG